RRAESFELLKPCTLLFDRYASTYLVKFLAVQSRDEVSFSRRHWNHHKLFYKLRTLFLALHSVLSSEVFLLFLETFPGSLSPCSAHPLPVNRPLERSSNVHCFSSN